jgi:phosphatidylglycerol:prolipoprotein diacylglycerol transferase
MDRGTAYLALVGSGLLVWTLGCAWLCHQDGLRAWWALALCTLSVTFGHFGGRLHSLVLETGLPITKALEEPHLLLTLGGGRFGGGLVAGLVAIFVLAPVLRLHLPTVLDASMAVSGIAYAVARVGCFVAGCCFGRVCLRPWGIRYPPETEAHLNHLERGLIPADAAYSLPVHPFPLYAAAVGLATSLLLLRMRKYRRFRGEVGLLGMALFCGGIAGVEFLREPIGVKPVPMRQGFPASLASTALIGWAVVSYRVGRMQRLRGPAPVTEGASSARIRADARGDRCRDAP